MLSDERKQDLREARALPPLLETSLARIWQHHRERSFVILTAWRGDKDKQVNRANLKRLKAQVRAAGYGFIQLIGVGQEKDAEGNIIYAQEPSLLIPTNEKSAEDGRALLKKALKWGKQYEQYAIFFHTVSEDKDYSAVIEVDGGKREVLGKFKPQQVGQFFSKLKKGRTFKYEHLGYKYGEPVQGWIHGMGREALGELELYRCESVSAWLNALGG